MGDLQCGLSEYGLKLERGRLGMKLTGVLSPADIEANYQGFDLVFGVVFEYTSLDGVSFTHCHLRLSVDGWALV